MSQRPTPEESMKAEEWRAMLEAAAKAQPGTFPLPRAMPIDPLTAALVLANTVAEIIKMMIEAQSPETRAKFAEMQMQDLQKWRDFLDKLAPKKD